MTSHLNVDRDVSTADYQSSSGDGVDWVRYSIMYGGGLLWLAHFDPTIVSLFVLFLMRPLACRAPLAQWCFLIVGIHASDIPLSLDRAEKRKWLRHCPEASNVGSSARSFKMIGKKNTCA